MPRGNANQQQFYYSRGEIEQLFGDLFDKAIACKQCKNCIHCRRAKLVDFEVERKVFYTSNKNLKDWKVRLQGKIKRLVISPVF